MSPDLWLPAYFHWWHVPVIFLAGVAANVYGAAVGSSSILIQFALAALGMPLPNIIATDLAADLGSIAGVLRVALPREQMIRQKREIFLLMLPLLLGGVGGTLFLLHVQTQTLKYIIVAGLAVLLVHTLLNMRHFTGARKNIQFSRYLYPVLFVALFALALYGNICGVGAGAFIRLVFIGLLAMRISDAVGYINLLSIAPELVSFVGTALTGMIVWPYLVVLAAGNYFGGKWGVRLTRKIPEKWLRGALISVVAAYLVWLLAFV